MGTKKCSICNQEKPLSAFNKNRTKKDGRQTTCATCHRKYAHKHYVENKRTRKEQVKQHKKKIRKFFKEYKCGLVCVICGENRLPTLDFHHLDNSKKEHTISQMVAEGYSIESLCGELKKCVPLCANCHRMVHHAGVM